MNIGLIGLGNVGHAVYTTLASRVSGCRIVAIGVKDMTRQRSVCSDMLTDNIEAIVDDPEVDVIVEAITDAVVAYAILKRALQKGKPVVTANKKMVAEHLPEIVELQERYGVPVLYEAAVCGAIPVLRLMDEYYRTECITSIEGIFNGTTNYILTKIFASGSSYGEALGAAQHAGFAEADPFLDVSGRDARYKLAILIAHAFGVFVAPEAIHCFGIDRISAVDVRFARERGMVIKLVASVYRKDTMLYGMVMPRFVAPDSVLGRTQNEYNVVSVEAGYSGGQCFTGRGAGSHPTSSAIAYDVAAVLNDYRYRYDRPMVGVPLSFSHNAFVEVMVSATDHDDVLFTDFIQVNEGYAGRAGGYMVGKIALDKVTELWERGNVSLVMLPEKAMQAWPDEHVAENIYAGGTWDGRDTIPVSPAVQGMAVNQ